MRRAEQSLPRLATFSITARCARTGQLGVGISTKFIAVGALAPNAKARVGACSTQAFVNPYHRYWVIEYLSQGQSAEEALRNSLARDPRPQLRQLAVVDAQGRSAAHTGERCDTWCGHRVGPNYAAAGNMLANGDVVAEMARVFEETEGSDLPLAERLLRCLEAAEAAGGDKRGKQSAALLIVDTEDYPKIDLRVDDHPEPVAELRRLYELFMSEFAEILEGLPTRADPAGKIGEEFLSEGGSAE
ncbi:MAG TPA: DUF1028 domain-containing protein [Caldilineae bacterium]|nr:DUF1028 domain-containing protein [Caldilineae bacterium]